MNKTIKYAMVTIVAIVAMFSCKKEINYNAFPDPNGNGCKLMSLKSTGILGDYTINFAYDAIGRVSKATTTDGQTNTYVYNINKITATDQDGEVNEINLANGRATTSGQAGQITVGNANYDNTKQYTYNSEGYLIQVKNYHNGVLNSTDDLTYSNGNLTKAVSVDAVVGYITTNNYSYSTDKAVNAYEVGDPLAYHVDYFPGGYFGKQSKNILVKVTSKTANSSGSPFADSEELYTYVFDSKGNATAININQTSTSYSLSGVATKDTFAIKYALGYNCK